MGKPFEARASHPRVLADLLTSMLAPDSSAAGQAGGEQPEPEGSDVDSGDDEDVDLAVSDGRRRPSRNSIEFIPRTSELRSAAVPSVIAALARGLTWAAAGQSGAGRPGCAASRKHAVVPEPSVLREMPGMQGKTPLRAPAASKTTHRSVPADNSVGFSGSGRAGDGAACEEKPTAAAAAVVAAGFQCSQKPSTK